ncbi:hypothetical protein D3C85_1497990 [compost metagenome]
MPTEQDAELTLLKGHLLIEEILTAVIMNGVKRPKHLDFARMQFHQKMKLARAVFPGEDPDWIWVALKSLNDARNKLAHGLDQAATATAVKKLIDYVLNFDPISGEVLERGEEPPQPLNWILFSLYSYLIVYGDVVPPRRNQLLEHLSSLPATHD